MLNPALARWRQAVFGFGGLGGLRWFSSVLSARAAHVPECHAPADIASPGTEYLSVNGQPVAYRELGRGEPAIVLLHGFGMTLESWDAVQQSLAARHRTVALDLWGFGASARPETARSEGWVDQVLGVMDALQISEAVLVGHSLGGRVALMCTRSAPERVLGLTLCDSDFGHVPLGYLMVWLLAHGPAIPGILRRLRGDRGALRRMMEMVSTPAFHITEDVLERYHEPLLVRGTAACWGSLARGPWLADARGLPAQVRRPVGLLWGADDPVVPLEWGRLLAQRLAGSELTVVPDCGHFPQEEHPQQVAAAVTRLLRRL
jgi:pimeloyl-ACP methyl ester carboxylesterase